MRVRDAATLRAVHRFEFLGCRAILPTMPNFDVLKNVDEFRLIRLGPALDALQQGLEPLVHM